MDNLPQLKLDVLKIIFRHDRSAEELINVAEKLMEFILKPGEQVCVEKSKKPAKK